MKVLNRIKANDDFVKAVRKGKTLKSNAYVVHFLVNELNICRIGISVSKKIANAVTRNRIKRQIRAMCDSLIDYNVHAYDIVIVIRQDYLNQDFDNNKATLNKLLSEIGITK